MLASEQLRGLRVVADPAAIDGARWAGERDELGRDQGGVEVLRFAPDEAFAIGARHVELDDEHAIVMEERGFIRIEMKGVEVGQFERHVEWQAWESDKLMQGAVAGVPAKVRRSSGDGSIVLVTYVAYTDELLDRLR